MAFMHESSNTTSPSSSSSSEHASSPEPEPGASLPTGMASNPSNIGSTSPSASALAVTHIVDGESNRTEQPNGSVQGTPPTSTTPELARTHSTGKGGCWTCRVRRKKCDEQRVDNSCATCRRLRIKCLGWGAKRPDWMRDKEKVAAYKAEIKAQLTREGLIRGQPRTSYSQLTSTSRASSYNTSAITSTMSSTQIRHESGASTSRHPHPYSQYRASPYQQAIAGPGPATMTRRRPVSFPMYDMESFPAHEFLPTETDDPLGARSAGSTPGSELFGPASFGGIDLNPSPSYNGISQPATGGMGYPTQQHHSVQPQATPSPFGEYAVPDFLAGQNQQQQQLDHHEVPMHVLMTEPNYLQYYFQYVRKHQFAFAAPGLAETLYYIVFTEQQGALAYALRALAGLHHARCRIAVGLAPLTGGPVDQTLSYQQFYEQGRFLLLNAATLEGRYSEKDAIAAVYLAYFAILISDGGAAGSVVANGWTTILRVAYEWLKETGLCDEQNPKLMLMRMTPAQRLATRATIWMDIFTAIPNIQPPRFLALYRTLFTGGAGFWASAAQHTNAFDLRMDKLTGCPDEAVLALAETAALAHWKHTHQRAGSLSVRELVRKAEKIEGLLRAKDAQPQARSWTVEGSPIPDLDSLLDGTMSWTPVQEQTPVDEGMRRTVAALFHESAQLYLHTVISDAHPAVPEIQTHVQKMMDIFQSFGPSDVDRALLFPLVLVGSLTDHVLIHHVTNVRFTSHGDASVLGPMELGRRVIERVRDQRAATATVNGRRGGTPAVDWRDIIREEWPGLLLL